MQPFTNHALALSFLLAFALPAEAFDSARINLVSTDAEHVYFEVSGTWPNTCPPQLLEMSAQGRELLLLATRETQGCHATPTPYAFSSKVLPREELMPEPGIHRVRLEINASPGHEPSLAGFALVQPEPAESVMALETGFWWAEQGGEFGAAPGLGLSVETQAGLITLSVMGYDEHGSSAWYFGAGELTNGVAHLDLGQFEGGAGPFTRYAAPETIQLSGAVDVETLSPSHAVLWFSRADAHSGEISLRPLSIMRFSFAQEPADALLGRWLIAASKAGERDTRWVNFIESETFRDGFILHDEDETVSLRCDTPADRPGSPPSTCRMEGKDGDVVEFTDIALRRLSGWDAHAQHTVAFRLD